MNTDTKPKRQVIFGVDDPNRVKQARAIREIEGEVVPLTDAQKAQGGIVSMIVTMKKVQENTPEVEAKLNKDTMSDNNGGRITFNEDLVGSKVIKGVEERSQDSIKKK